jgi:NADH:ubiquinone oxidoreductase subunit 5 (subunit L)/multisubunit Na+/H+ antiporter MnhA subunit
MIVNRVGDVGLALAISLIFLTFKSIDYAVVFALSTNASYLNYLIGNFEISRLSVITFLLFFGAVGKSAQIGLHI